MGKRHSSLTIRRWEAIIRANLDGRATVVVVRATTEHAAGRLAGQYGEVVIVVELPRGGTRRARGML